VFDEFHPASVLLPGQVELENWVEQPRPLTQVEIERAFIIDNAIFELHPCSGRLQPGATETVSMKATHCILIRRCQRGFKNRLGGAYTATQNSTAA
jgi:hypothetical protein